jgi:hypothetical protein
MSDLHIREALDDYINHIGVDSPRAEKIKAALKQGMYPPKYIYLLVLEGQL